MRCKKSGYILTIEKSDFWCFLEIGIILRGVSEKGTGSHTNCMQCGNDWPSRMEDEGPIIQFTMSLQN